VILAPPYSGKTTAHRDRLVIDPEELPEYNSWKQGWGDPAKANSSEWRAQQRSAYTGLVNRLATEGYSPLATHVDSYYQFRDALQKHRYRVVLLRPEAEVLSTRMLDDVGYNPGKPYHRARVSAAISGVRLIEDLLSFTEEGYTHVLDIPSLRSLGDSSPGGRVEKGDVRDGANTVGMTELKDSIYNGSLFKSDASSVRLCVHALELLFSLRLASKPSKDGVG